jgi:hypothetical protein
MNINQTRALYLSLRAQYLSDRPMTPKEEQHMWDAWHELNMQGYYWKKIKDCQLRENRNLCTQ